MFRGFILSIAVDVLAFLAWRLFGLLCKNLGNFSDLMVTMSSLLQKNILQKGQIFQLFTMNIKTESIYKSNEICQAKKLGRRDPEVY